MAPGHVALFVAQAALLCALLLHNQMSRLAASQPPSYSGAGARARGIRAAAGSSLEDKSLSSSSSTNVLAMAPQDSRVELGYDVRLNCSLRQLPDAGIVVWTKGGNILGTSTNTSFSTARV